MKKIFIILPVIILSLLIIIITTVLIFLSVLFPNEYFRKKIEIEGTQLFGTNVSLKKLKFSIFTGIHLNGLNVIQIGKGWKYPKILEIDSIRLEYRLLPLLKREISVKGFVIEKGLIHLERKNNKANWDYFLQKYQSIINSKKEEKKPINKTEKKEISRSEMPINININKIGLDGLTITYDDNSLLDIPVTAKISNMKLLGKNIDIKQNKPFDLDGKIDISLDAGTHLVLTAAVKADGKLKLFNDNSTKIALNGPVKLKLEKASFSSKEIKDLIIKFIENFIGATLGSSIKSGLQDTRTITERAQKYFDDISETSDSKIKEMANKADEIFKKKDDLLKYKDNIITDFDKNLNLTINDVEKEINEIDGKVSPVLDSVSEIPFVEKIIDLKKYKKRIKELKKNATDKKNEIVTRYRSGLQNETLNIINSQFPKVIPNYETLKKQFTKLTQKYKNEIGGNLKKYSISSFIKSLLPDMSFFEKNYEIKNLSTVYYLGEKQSDAKDVNFVTKYFETKGKMLMIKKYIEYSGNMGVNVKEFNLTFMPIDKISCKVNINGEIPKLKISLLDIPKLEIDKSKTKMLIVSILDNFLKNNYSDNKILSSIIGGINLENIDTKKIKDMINGAKDKKIDQLSAEKSSLTNYINEGVNKIIQELQNFRR